VCTRVDPTIFREYDIRGLTDRQLTPEAVELIARAYGTFAAERGAKKVTIGRDCRDSSPRLAESLRRGLVRSGLDVLDCGVITTPMQYFSLQHFDAGGGIQITGSHNPPEYNGLKISVGKTTVHGEDIQTFKRMIEAEAFRDSPRAGAVEEVDVVAPYVDYCASNIQLGKRRLKVNRSHHSQSSRWPLVSQKAGMDRP